ncbi:4-hydroxythreonine-4-phosphate dehydrogenase [Bombella sp. TMW 2.2559]|uniref:4-hydroxythreonine-4-phosphate dehydrogenase n=1 Tax=Bombella dulcis TaxID=2967339 RepID=A0ABT3WHA6_9PROT|nr:4-hydroxythreonine-4-phosphate dehydrogenase [Bombella dulcis]MCX5616256.1 4-hydroxythreonine-4-phosphate dehydrogenase [Bombella dulcis]
METFRFIFMLTCDDRTVETAMEAAETALRLGIRHIGFKDIGLPVEELRALADRLRSAGATSYLEIVSPDRERELDSVRAGLALGVDCLMGGTHVPDVLPLLAGHDVAYYPFAGHVVGHPSVLKGSPEEIARNAAEWAVHPAVTGLDLLAYRNDGNVPEVIRASCAAVGKPVIVAGSISTPEQIRTVRQAGAAGFTVGTAVLDGIFPARSTSLEDQLRAVMACL